MSEEKATYQCSLSAQDLRIGDWVYDGERTQFPKQVVGLGNNWVYLDFPGNEGDLWEADVDITFHSSDINYLHQLQNTYYMATGEELNIQP